jgi:Leucine-rich repeat (LRR) protein
MEGSKFNYVYGDYGDYQKLDPNLQCLFCPARELTKLELPENLPELTYLFCDRNQLTKIHVYPKLYLLICNNNKLTEIPYLVKLDTLYCKDNLLMKIPELPQLLLLDCTRNVDLKVPYLVKLREIYCGGCKHFKAAGIIDITSYRKFLNKVDIIVVLLIWSTSKDNKIKLSVDLVRTLHNNYLIHN